MELSYVWRCNYRVYADVTVGCMPMELSEATGIAERMLNTYFSIWHELGRVENAYDLPTRGKMYRQSFFQGV